MRPVGRAREGRALDFRIPEPLFEHRRARPPRADGVDANPILDVIERGGLGEPDHPVLGRAVRGDAGGADQPAHGRGVPDRAAAVRFIAAISYFMQRKTPVRLMPTIRCHAASSTSAIGAARDVDAGIVERDVQPAESAHGPIDHGRAIGGTDTSERMNSASTPCCLRRCRGGPAVRFIHVAQHQTRAFRGKGQCGALCPIPDAGARHKYALAVESCLHEDLGLRRR